MLAIGPQVIGIFAAGQFAMPPWGFGLFGPLTRQRLRAWFLRVPLDRMPLPLWRLAVGGVGTAALAVAWWYGVGRALT